MEEAKYLKYTNRHLHYFIQQYKLFKYVDYQVHKIYHHPHLNADTKSIKYDHDRKKCYLLQRQIVTQEYKILLAFFYTLVAFVYLC